jgi:hypothetical protein
VTASTAKTISGLLAQARLLPMLLDDDAGSITESTEAFIRSFVVDVRSRLEQIEDTGLLADTKKDAARPKTTST